MKENNKLDSDTEKINKIKQIIKRYYNRWNC